MVDGRLPVPQELSAELSACVAQCECSFRMVFQTHLSIGNRTAVLLLSVYLCIHVLYHPCPLVVWFYYLVSLLFCKCLLG